MATSTTPSTSNTSGPRKSTSTSSPTGSRKLRWSVPLVDVSTNRWLDNQHSVGLSLQMLIREAIQRDGYNDVFNKPVEQLPRRGRPPQADPADEAEQAVEAEQADGWSQDSGQEIGSRDAQGDAPALRVARGSDAPPPVDEPQADEPQPQPGESTQVDMDDIFSRRAR